jgi:hypothetical protein
MGLTRGEIVAAAHGRVYRGEPVTRQPLRTPAAAHVEPIAPAALRAHIEHARQLRAEVVADLCGRSIHGLLRRARLLGRPRRAGRGLTALAGHHGPSR